MNIEIISNICNNLQSVTSDIKWEDDLCFNIGAKMFFVVSLENIPTTASFKVADEDFERLTAQPGFSPAPYLGRYKWVQVDDITRLTQKQWDEYIEKSYAAIASKLPKKVKSELKIC